MFRKYDYTEDSSSLVFFAYRVGRPMTEDRSWLKSNIFADIKPFYSSPGKEADIQIKKFGGMTFTAICPVALMFFMTRLKNQTMEKLTFSILINAPKEKVWDNMLGAETYRKWTEVFMPGSYFDGDWRQGSKILFLAPDGKGNNSGMVSRIKANRLHEFISIEHLGFVENGKEDTTSEAVKSWAGALENYTFKEMGGSTEVLVELDTAEEHKEMFESTWNDALKILKTITEN